MYVSVHMSFQNIKVDLSPVLQWEASQLGVVVDPFELQRPASFRHARQHQPVAFQMELTAHRLRLEVGRYIVCEEQRRLNEAAEKFR